VRVDHGRAHISIPEQLLDRADAVPIVKQMGRERVAEGMATGRFGNTGPANGFPDEALADAGRVVGIEVLDHMVVGDGRYVSLRERGALME
jgi:hypothetical protein